MYEYRRLTPDEREAVLVERRRRGFPLHSPPHLEDPGRWRIVTGTCFEHRDILASFRRLHWFEGELLARLKAGATPCAARCVLPNHYHVLVRVGGVKPLARSLGRLHGRTSLAMNREDGTPGRRCWFRSQDRCMRSERHYYTTLNYIHNNPVKHGLADGWSDWPFSSFAWYLEKKGRDWLLDLWRRYPVLDYGKGWDP